jgi:CBS domain-containing protein
MLTVRDIMQAKVVTVTPDATIRDLARLLADEQISGVPVLDGAGQLVGVVSSTDLVRLTAEGADVDLVSVAFAERADRTIDPDEDDDEDGDPYGFFLPEDTPLAEQAMLAELPESRMETTTVEDIMTPVTFTVEPDTPVAELCDFLVRGRIHRAVVVKNRRLEGIVTSADVLRAVADGRLGR